MRDQAQQNVLNQLEANNQLTSSVTGNRLSELNEAFSADISDIATTFYLADVERSLANISALFGTGLDTLDAVGARGLQNQSQVNEFNLQQYDRQVALENERFQRQLAKESSDARMLGLVTGGIGGGIYGATKGNSDAAYAGLMAPIDSATGIIGNILAAKTGGASKGISSAGGVATTASEGLNQRLVNANARRNVGLGTPSSGGLV